MKKSYVHAKEKKKKKTKTCEGERKKILHSL